METKRIKAVSIKDKLAKFYEHLPLDVQVRQYNAYCENFDMKRSSFIYPMHMLDVIMQLYKPSEIIQKTSHCDLEEPYFRIDENENIYSMSEYDILDILIDATYDIADKAVRDFRETGGHTTWLCGCVEMFLQNSKVKG